MADPWGISGPDFVVLYIALLGAVLLIRVIVSGIVTSRAMRADAVAPGPPPTVYQLAFLAGGPDRAVDAAVAALVERGQLRVNSYKQVSQAGTRPWCRGRSALPARFATHPPGTKLERS